MNASDWTLFQPGDVATAGWPGEAQAKLTPPWKETGDDTLASDDGNASATTNRSLSQQLWSGCTSTGDCSSGTLFRSTYRRYKTGSAAEDNRRNPTSERTVFHDDTGCGGAACYVQNDESDFDRVGHYRTAVRSSNFPGVTGDTSTTGYLSWTTAQLTSSNTAWILNRYTSQTRTIGASTAQSTFCFDSSGQLTHSRVFAGASENAKDFVSVYTYSDGNVQTESSYGGDGSSLDTFTDLCNVNLGALGYKNRYTWNNGVLATSRYVNPSTGSDLSFKSLDYTSDPGTGLVTISKGTDELATQYDYEIWGRLSAITPPGETPTTLNYTNATATAFAKIEAKRDPSAGSDDDVTLTYHYDRLGRLQRTQKNLPGAGCVEQVATYDGQGRKSTESIWNTCGASTSLGTTFLYDALGRVKKVTAPDGSITTIAYTGQRAVRRTMNIGNATVTNLEEYDALGRIVKVVEDEGGPDSVTANYEYDIGDRLTKVTIPDGSDEQIRVFTYDNRGVLLSEQHPELGANGNGTTEYSSYDARGHARQKVTGDVDLTFEYDPAERLSVITETATGRERERTVYDWFDQCGQTALCRGKIAAAVRYNYDADLGDPDNGNVLPVTETYQYNAGSGRPARRDQAIGTTDNFSGSSFHFSQIYNSLGDVHEVIYPCRFEGCASERTRSAIHGYKYGTLNRIGTWATDITYHPSGIINMVTHGSGTSAVKETWTADTSGLARPGKIRATNAGGTELWSSGDYSYDGAGNVTRIGTTDYTYDGLGRLTGWKASMSETSYNTTTVGYDRFGNPLFSVSKGCGNASGQTVCWGSGFVVRQLHGTSNHYVDFTYDDAGNLISDGGRTFTYDSLGMTRAVIDGRDYRYLYAPGGERIAIVERTGNTSSTAFTIRGFANELLSIWKTNSQGTLFWSEDTIRRGSSLLAHEGTTTGRRHYVLDHLGSPRFIANGSTGLAIGTQSFEPFGGGGTSNGGALQFTGQERDAAFIAGGMFGLPDYFHARYYDPGWGRFLLVDPVLDTERAVKSPQVWNRYSYCVNNPLARVDPDGRSDLYADPTDYPGNMLRVRVNVWYDKDTVDLELNRGGTVRSRTEQSMAEARRFFAAAGILLEYSRQDASRTSAERFGANMSVSTTSGEFRFLDLAKMSPGVDLWVTQELNVTGRTSGTGGPSIIGSLVGTNTVADELAHAFGNVRSLLPAANLWTDLFRHKNQSAANQGKPMNDLFTIMVRGTVRDICDSPAGCR